MLFVLSRDRHASSQTELDEDGLWGVDKFSSFRKVNKMIPFRIWQRAVRFVRCPKCQGRRGVGSEKCVSYSHGHPVVVFLMSFRFSYPVNPPITLLVWFVFCVAYVFTAPPETTQRRWMCAPDRGNPGSG